MELTPHIERLLADVAAAAALGDDETKRVVAALARPTESAARLMLIGALSEFAREVEEGTGTGVGIRIEGDRVDVDPRDRGDRDEPQDHGSSSFEEMTGDISRVTLRLVEQMKARAEEAAAQNGVSLNSWVAQAVQGALRDQSKYRDRYRDYGDKWKAGKDYFQDLNPDDFRSSNWKKRTDRTGDTDTPHSDKAGTDKPGTDTPGADTHRPDPTDEQSNDGNDQQ